MMNPILTDEFGRLLVSPDLWWDDVGFAAMVRATPQELTQCPGLGERKVQRLAALASDPFVPSRGGRDEPSTSSVRGVADA